MSDIIFLIETFLGIGMLGIILEWAINGKHTVNVNQKSDALNRKLKSDNINKVSDFDKNVEDACNQLKL
jgi:uncharacterized membrane protein YciS (DUF1049 family)